jgi:hypothetical protein
MSSAKPAPPKTAPYDARKLRLEQLLAMSLRIGDAIALDIDALEKGRFDELKTTDPEIERLCTIYGQEVKALKADGGAKDAPPELAAKLRESGARLNGLLARHRRLVSCMRHASEGLVQAVAEEVQKTRERAAPYSASPQAKRGPGDAIVYNNVV